MSNKKQDIIKVFKIILIPDVWNDGN